MITEETARPSPTASMAGSADPAEFPESAQRALTFGLLFSACRCTLQYVLLPFVLPWIGIAASVPQWLLVLLGLLAVAALVKNARFVWRMRHARRWSYVALASVASAALLLFVAIDLHKLLIG